MPAQLYLRSIASREAIDRHALGKATDLAVLDARAAGQRYPFTIELAKYWKAVEQTPRVSSPKRPAGRLHGDAWRGR